MLRAIILCATVMFVGLVNKANAANCEPGANEVTFYQHTNFRGKCSILGIGQYRNSKAMGIKNDSISSIKIGKNVQTTVCKHAAVHSSNPFWGDQQKCQTYKKSVLFFHKSHRMSNDDISSARIMRRTASDTHPPGECYPGNNSNSVAIYQHPNLKGHCRILYIGKYRNSKEMNFRNDSVSSIEIGLNSKVHATICSDSNFRGRCESVYGTDVNLKDNEIGDNKLTSIAVFKK